MTPLGIPGASVPNRFSAKRAYSQSTNSGVTRWEVYRGVRNLDANWVGDVVQYSPGVWSAQPRGGDAIECASSQEAVNALIKAVGL